MNSTTPRVQRSTVRALRSLAPIVILGMTAVGKTSIGRSLAAVAKIPFVDSDQEIEVRTGRRCSRIIVESGEAVFREIEKSTVLSLLNSDPKVLALGGGAWMDEEVRSKALNLATTVWVNIDALEIVRRVRNEGRVIALNSDGTDRVQDLLDARRDIYAQANVHVELRDETVHEATQIVVHALRALGETRVLVHGVNPESL